MPNCVGMTNFQTTPITTRIVVLLKHHHPELFALPATIVTKIHGKSLTLDLVALRPIEPGEEIMIDFGTT